MARLARGQYYWPTPESGVTDVASRAQVHFFDALEQLAPELKTQLDRRLEGLSEQPSDASKIRNVVSSWGREHGLGDYWTLTGIIQYLGWGGYLAEFGWIIDVYEREYDSSKQLQKRIRQCKSGIFRFSHPGLDISRITLAQLKREVTESFRAALVKYASDARREAERKGWKKVPTKRRRKKVKKRGSTSSRHFEWLVRFQVLGHTYDKIGDDTNTAPSAVADAVRTAAEQIGLTLRTNRRRGRPAKRVGKPIRT